jgi:predicted O-methyltransferase YrrM
LFDPTGGAGEGHRMPEHGPALYRQVTARFAAFPKIHVIKGRVPDSFAQACPEKIAFLHIDMNSAETEIAALEHLFDRVVPGGVIVLDDYGYRCYRAQHDAENEFAKARGYPIVELPTGQGLLIKR